MLVRLYGSNFRSLKNRFDLSMVAADLTRKEDRDRGMIEVEITGATQPLRLLRSLAIFGPNASGKSTVLLAAQALYHLGLDSSIVSRPDAAIQPYEPFLLDHRSKSSPIELGCDVIFKKSILRYEIVYDSKTIQRETLTVLDGKDQRKLIERTTASEVGGDLITKSEVNRLYVKEMQPNVSVLSKLTQHGPHRGKESVQPYYRAIRDSLRRKDYSQVGNSVEMQFGFSRNMRFDEDQKYRDWIMKHLINAADVGINDVRTRRVDLEIPRTRKDRPSNSEEARAVLDEAVHISFIHEGDSSRPIEFSAESAGTKKLFGLADDWWTLAHEGVTLFADELSASLHPKLLDRMIRAVNEASTVHTPSQLVFSTHDTGLLEAHEDRPPALRRDQVYFTKKDRSGATELYSLAEFKEEARPVHNIRKRYLSGLYGAIPFAEKLSL